MNTKTIQITAGRGPAACCWVVAQVLKSFIGALQEAKVGYTLLHREPGPENRTLQSVTLALKGKGLDALLSHWLGTIQWVGTSPYRTMHKRKNWYVGFFELPATEAISISEKDFQFQAMRSSGAGGQHVNKVSSAIRATHPPTGMQVVVMDSRSQHQNKKLAIMRLQEKVAQFQREQLKQQLETTWENHQNVTRGNPVQVFKGRDFRRQQVKRIPSSERMNVKQQLKQGRWD